MAKKHTCGHDCKPDWRGESPFATYLLCGTCYHAAREKALSEAAKMKMAKVEKKGMK